ncbi:hypothetical protein CFIO01_11983 [Colletotrichum fioriniae PJ7]|uniref:Uncharacterized protein n=1 Tax=Colletotrichum fioriniae PJ7 TaxID=1445577 RepID=A0A010RL61_9PEZI|nr:hypothetical protein CFIO01_11983 [Colletotrichum fioriniae PJ7]
MPNCAASSTSLFKIRGNVRSLSSAIPHPSSLLSPSRRDPSAGDYGASRKATPKSQPRYPLARRISTPDSRPRVRLRRPTSILTHLTLPAGQSKRLPTMRSTATRLQQSMLSRVVSEYSREAKPAAAAAAKATKRATAISLSPRELYKRIGKCLAFGCNPDQTQRAASLLRAINNDWRNLHAVSQGFYDPKNSAYTTRLRDGEPSHRPWLGISQVSTLTQVAEQSIAHFLDHVLETADPQDRQEWESLRDNQTRNKALTTLQCQSESSPQSRAFSLLSLEPQVISAYTRLLSNDYEEKSTFSFKVVVYSHKRMAKIADLNMRLKTNSHDNKPLPWLSRELKRVADLTSTDAERNAAYTDAKYIGKMVSNLELGTWKRPDATEDFGTAAP